MSDWAQTACILCECNCGIEVQLDGRKLERIRGDKAHPGSQGYTCNKAMRLDRYQNGPHRLTSPLRRTPDGGYEEIDWDRAITELAAGFKRIADEHGGESILLHELEREWVEQDHSHAEGCVRHIARARRSQRTTGPRRPSARSSGPQSWTRSAPGPRS
jgi:anaerobic selenocysteine-containing dehydrogenase